MLNGHGGNINNICNTFGLKPGEIMDFSASINPLGYPYSVRKVVMERLNDILHYPDSEGSELRKIIAKIHSCKESNIIIGNGSNELFHLIPRALKPKLGIVLHPTFSEFKKALYNADIKIIEIINNCKALKFNLHDSNLQGLKDGLVFLCNPNNPTGHLITRKEILEFVKDHPEIIIVVDEAFMDFVEEKEKFSVIKEAAAMKNLIVVRSLTKFYGFPGLRLGYLLACESVINSLWQFKEPWTVNTLAQVAGQVALNDNEFAFKTKRFMSSEKKFLYEGLSGIKDIYPFYPSANFILVKIENDKISSSKILNLLVKDKIIIRDCSNFTGLSNRYFRVAVRVRDENQKLLSSLKFVMDSVISDVTDERDFVRDYVVK